MSRQLVESILSGNMLEANDMVEAKMAEIRERKMYEMKRMYAAESIRDPNAPETWSGGRRSGPEFEAFLKRNAEKAAKSGAKDTETPQRRKRPPGGVEKDPYVGKGNMPHIMAARLGRHIAKKAGDLKKAVTDYKPDAPGTAVLKTTKGLAKGAKHVVKSVSDSPVVQDLKSIGFRNL